MNPPQLPNDVFLLIVKALVRPSPRDYMRAWKIRPGKLKLPHITLCIRPIHGDGSATVSLPLPNYKEYVWQRTINYSRPGGPPTPPQGQEEWQSIMLANTRGHADLPPIFDGESIGSWTMSAVDATFIEEN